MSDFVILATLQRGVLAKPERLDEWNDCVARERAAADLAVVMSSAVVIWKHATGPGCLCVACMRQKRAQMARAKMAYAVGVR